MALAPPILQVGKSIAVLFGWDGPCVLQPHVEAPALVRESQVQGVSMTM